MLELFHFFWISLAGIALIFLAEWMYYNQKVHVEITRKIVHVGSGLLALLLPVFFHNQWVVLLMCGLAQLVLVISVNNGLLKSINAVKRKTYGSILFPMVVYLVYLAWYYSGSRQHHDIQSYAYFQLPILILALCHPLANWIGLYYPLIKFKHQNKSLGGMLAFWALAFLLSCIILLASHLFNTKDITWVAIFIATLTSITEVYSKKGFSNLSIPIVVLLALYIVEYFF